MIKVAHLS